jgi:hypothetical protein
LENTGALLLATPVGLVQLLDVVAPEDVQSSVSELELVVDAKLVASTTLISDEGA